MKLDIAAALASWTIIAVLVVAAVVHADPQQDFAYTRPFNWRASWESPSIEFQKPYPRDHLRIYQVSEPDLECGRLWDQSNGRVYAKSCTIPPQNDRAALGARLGFIARHQGWGGKWRADPTLCVLVLPKTGFFGVSDEEYESLRKFEEPHCWGWRE
jgi:hypothetical protein